MSEMIHAIPLAEIYADNDFNCRANISPASVKDLAESIRTTGLLQPITIQPFTKVPPYKYRVIMGYRRFHASRLIQAQTINCFIREGLTEEEAKIINLTENIHRRDLSLMEEALQVQYWLDKGWGHNDIKSKLKVSGGWLQIRLNLLALPDEVQKLVIQGYVNQEQIKDLYSHRDDPEKMMALAMAIKSARQRGDKSRIRVNKVSLQEARKKASEAKVQSRTELFKMQDLIMDAIGPCLASRVLAWASGVITAGELMLDIQKAADDLGKKWRVPPDKQTIDNMKYLDKEEKVVI